MVLLLTLLVAAPALAGQSVRLVLEGVSGQLKENVEALLSLRRQRPDAKLSEARIRRLFDRGPEEIRLALEPFGYYRPQIESELKAPAGGSEVWTARYRIDPRDPIRIRHLDIRIEGEGRDAPFLKELIESLPLRQGQPLVHADYEESKRQLLDRPKREGYLDAAYTESRILVDKAAYTTDVELHIATGPLFRFGPVQFEQDLFTESYLRRFIPFQTGAPYTTRNLADFRNALYRSGYFQEVDIQPQKDQASQANEIPLRVVLKAFDPNRYQGRVGYGTNTKIGVRLGWDRRYLNRYGHSFNLGTIAVQDRNKLIGEFRYLVPLEPLEDSYLDLVARHEGKDLTYDDPGVDLPEGDQTRIIYNALGLAKHHPRRLWGDVEVEESVGLTYLAESYSIFDLLFGHYPQDLQDFFSEVLGPDNLAILEPDFKAFTPTLGWTYRDTDNSRFPTHGSFVDLRVLGAQNGLGSNSSFLQARLKASFIRGVLENGRLIARADLGYTHVDTLELLGFAFNQMPEAYEFKTGGSQSVRGYEYESLIPDNSFTGGRELLTASIEYEHRIFTDWSLAAFYDIGNAFNEFSDMQLKAGTGVGVRWYSPLGLVRLDLAHALDNDYSPFRVHFTVGPEF